MFKTHLIDGAAAFAFDPSGVSNCSASPTVIVYW